MLYNRPDLMHHILAINATSVAQYLNAQIDAGAQAVMIFDSWGGALADGAYQEFSLAYMQQVVAQLKRDKDGVKIPAIVFTKGGGQWIEQIADIGADAVGLDWTVNLTRASWWGIKWACRATSTRPSCSPAPSRSAPKWQSARRLRCAVGRARATCSTWAMAFPVHAAGIRGSDGGSRAQHEPRHAQRSVTSAVFPWPGTKRQAFQRSLPFSLLRGSKEYRLMHNFCCGNKRQCKGHARRALQVFDY